MHTGQLRSLRRRTGVWETAEGENYGCRINAANA
jgi:hypothetical protein